MHYKIVDIPEGKLPKEAPSATPWRAQIVKELLTLPPGKCLLMPQLHFQRQRDPLSGMLFYRGHLIRQRSKGGLTYFWAVKRPTACAA